MEYNFTVWGEVHDPKSNRLLHHIPAINGTIGSGRKLGLDTIKASIDLSIPSNEWSRQWSAEGPDKFHIEVKYASSPYGHGPQWLGDLDPDRSWTSRAPPCEFFVLPNISFRTTKLSLSFGDGQLCLPYLPCHHLGTRQIRRLFTQANHN